MSIDKILMAYDGSDSSRRAFRFALDVAAKFNSELHVVTVVHPPEFPDAVEMEAILEAATDATEKEFESLRAEAAKAGLTLETELATGHPAEQIVHVATEMKADLIVMGHRGKSVMERWLVGSVSKRVVSYAPCSVTIVR